MLPEAATKATEAGARAFITYYWDLINYAQVTGDVKPLKGVSGPNCAGCNAGITGIGQHYRDGGRVVGGTHQVEVENVTELTTKSQSAFGFEATVFASHDAQTIVASDGTQDQRDPGTDEFTVYLLWVDAERWRLDVMEIQ
ncbi:DUF6318 family protein [Nocardioides sp. WS12]|uniref:DUF6318 family protein n=1 Tax=Nocardioides sp. WS12 TaxID=2486272 RepID=UPI001F18CD27|nr:DUF6318 family protein [Nocardioides sp. WS12]